MPKKGTKIVNVSSFNPLGIDGSRLDHLYQDKMPGFHENPGVRQQLRSLFTGNCFKREADATVNAAPNSEKQPVEAPEPPPIYRTMQSTSPMQLFGLNDSPTPIVPSQPIRPVNVLNKPDVNPYKKPDRYDESYHFLPVSSTTAGSAPSPESYGGEVDNDSIHNNIDHSSLLTSVTPPNKIYETEQPDTSQKPIHVDPLVKNNVTEKYIQDINNTYIGMDSAETHNLELCLEAGERKANVYSQEFRGTEYPQATKLSPPKADDPVEPRDNSNEYIMVNDPKDTHGSISQNLDVPTESQPKYTNDTALLGDPNQETNSKVVKHVGGTRKQKVAPNDFIFLRVLGKGSYGTVMLVRSTFDNQIYAMKMLRKDYIIRRHQIQHTRTERAVLESIRHPFIVELYYAFQTPKKLYFVMEYCPGGELFFHLSRANRFSEGRVRFYAAEIILALEFLHNLNVVYRDLKPENVLLDSEGHVRLTDFGLSKGGISDNFSTKSLCGTPEYLAPEILNQQGHGKAVDWWSLGALIFEMLTGLPPFYSKDRDRLFKNIRGAELKFPSCITPVARDLLIKLFNRNPDRRLGGSRRDAEEVKEHPFFASIDWNEVYNKNLTPPFKPQLKSVTDVQYFDREFVRLPAVNSEVPEAILGEKSDDLFPDFTYDLREKNNPFV